MIFNIFSYTITIDKRTDNKSIEDLALRQQKDELDKLTEELLYQSGMYMLWR